MARINQVGVPGVVCPGAGCREIVFKGETFCPKCQTINDESWLAICQRISSDYDHYRMTGETVR